MSTNNTKKRKLTNFLSVIIIGAIGSGLWDILLKNIFFNIGGLFVELVSHFNSNYIDHIYSDVGKGNRLDIIPSLFFIVIIIFLPVFIIRRISNYFDTIDDSNSTKVSLFSRIIDYFFKTKRRSFLFILIIMLPISIMYSDLLIKELSTFRAHRIIDRNLEIIRPYIPESEFFILRSKFRQIDNSQKLNETLNAINEVAKEHNISLPNSKFYGIN